MKHSHRMPLAAVVLTAVLASAPIGAQQIDDLTKLGFQAEPGLAIGTPCGINLLARFWYRNFGVAASGIYVPSSVDFLNGSGFEGALMYRFGRTTARRIRPFLSASYGKSNITGTAGGKTYSLTTNYIGLGGGVFYRGFHAQAGVGYGKFGMGSGKTIEIVPLLQIGYSVNIAASAQTGSSSSQGSSGEGQEPQGRKPKRGTR